VRFERLWESDVTCGGLVAFLGDGRRWAAGDGIGLRLYSDGRAGPRLAAAERFFSLRFLRPGLLAAPPLRFDLATQRFLDGPPALGSFERRACVASEDGEELAAIRYIVPEGDDAEDDYDGPRERVIFEGAVLDESDHEQRALAAGRRWLAAASAEISVWERAGLRKTVLRPGGLSLRALELAGERRLAGLDAGGRATLWDLEAAALLADWQAHDGDGCALLAHPHRPLLFSGGTDGALRAWSLSGALEGELHLGGAVRGLALSPDGERLLAAAPARLVMLRI
jgi:hypothetical protein